MGTVGISNFSFSRSLRFPFNPHSSKILADSIIVHRNGIKVVRELTLRQMGNATTTTFAMVDPICKSYVSDALGHIVVELKRVLDHNF